MQFLWKITPRSLFAQFLRRVPSFVAIGPFGPRSEGGPPSPPPPPPPPHPVIWSSNSPVQLGLKENFHYYKSHQHVYWYVQFIDFKQFFLIFPEYFLPPPSKKKKVCWRNNYISYRFCPNIGTWKYRWGEGGWGFCIPSPFPRLLCLWQKDLWERPANVKF